MKLQKALEAIALGFYRRSKLLRSDNDVAPLDYQIAQVALGKRTNRWCRKFTTYSGRCAPPACITYDDGTTGSCTDCLAKWFAVNGAKRLPKRKRGT